MIAATAVRQFIARSPQHPDLAAQCRHQRITAGLCEQQVRRQPHIRQRQAVGITAVAAQVLEDSRQPAFVGLVDRLGGGVHL
ncbi:hypothetical protein D3C80_1853630 [compost metagenome]